MPSKSTLSPPVPPSPRQALGQLGERIAATELLRTGYSIVAKNWRSGRHGEVDLIAFKENVLAFIEVKTRKGAGFGHPEESVHANKQAKLLLTAQHYLLQNPMPDLVTIRFDVIAITLPGNARPAEVKHIEGAFTCDG